MILCIRIPAYRLAVAAAASGEEPAVLADRFERGRIIEVSDTAGARGARIGQTVLQARAAVADARVYVHDPARSRARWDDLLDALDAVSPLIDDAGEGVAYLEMRGIEGGPAQWIARAERALEAFALPLRAACGENRFAAFAATHGPVLAALPLGILGIESKIVQRLALLGVRTLGELAALPHGPFVRRFGAQAAVWHDRARGIDPTPLRPRAHALQIDAALYGEGSAASEEQLLFAVRMLADAVARDLARAGRAAGALELLFECENGETRALQAGFAEATADPKSMVDVVRALLERMTFDSPVTGLRMRADRLDEGGVAAALFAQSAPDPHAFAVALTRVAVAAGAPAVCARTREAVRLEERWRYEAPELRDDARVDVLAGGAAQAVPQLRLLAVTEIDVTLRGNLPERVARRRVLESAGPWRVDDGWFSEAVRRDEYDVLLEDGLLWRIYRQGEHWYLRGAYD